MNIMSSRLLNKKRTNWSEHLSISSDQVRIIDSVSSTVLVGEEDNFYANFFLFLIHRDLSVVSERVNVK